MGIIVNHVSCMDHNKMKHSQINLWTKGFRLRAEVSFDSIKGLVTKYTMTETERYGQC